ncbi:hypothetical protein [Deinococcus sp. Arct2-2]|nr:hypothetical protein [Deinococcus sp. Arct2-2]
MPIVSSSSVPRRISSAGLWGAAAGLRRYGAQENAQEHAGRGPQAA